MAAATATATATPGRQASPMATKSRPNKFTPSPHPDDTQRAWFVVDVSGKVLGRAAAQIAHVLRGKHKPSFAPHADVGDFVVVVNAGAIRVTGRKLLQKEYHRHSGHPGGLRTVTLGRLLETHPERALEGAVRGMLPKNSLGRRMLRKLKVYTTAEHPHAAQQPQPLEVKA
jgi:large subunit ribosomal protein L13